MSRTATPAPLDDHKMWRRVLARLHPDAGGDEDLFVFATAVRERVSAPIATSSTVFDRPKPSAKPAPPKRDKSRIAFDPTLTFNRITAGALEAAASGALYEPYAELLRLLDDVVEPDPDADPWLAGMATVGASFKLLAAIGRSVGFDGARRGRFYRTCSDLSISHAHATHIIDKLKKGAA